MCVCMYMYVCMYVCLALVIAQPAEGERCLYGTIGAEAAAICGFIRSDSNP